MISKSVGLVFGAFIVLIAFSFYASFVHNQYVSDVAKLKRSIELNTNCEVALEQLERFGSTEEKNGRVRFSIVRNETTGLWGHRRDIETILTLYDPTTAFDDISFYVFCDTEGKVTETLLVGD